MMNFERPNSSTRIDDHPIGSFLEIWRSAIAQGSAADFNRQFASDVLWGSPFGAVVEGYDAIHGIHRQMFAHAGPSGSPADYRVENSRMLGDDVAVAYVRRVAERDDESKSVVGFDELALLVLVKREGAWWLAAAQHVPDRRDVYLSAEDPLSRIQAS